MTPFAILVFLFFLFLFENEWKRMEILLSSTNLELRKRHPILAESETARHNMQQLKENHLSWTDHCVFPTGNENCGAHAGAGCKHVKAVEIALVSGFSNVPKSSDHHKVKQ